MWMHHLGSSEIVVTVGLPGPGIGTARRCEGSYFRLHGRPGAYWWTHRASPWIRCDAHSGRRWAERWEEQVVTVHRWTHRVHFARHAWSVPDSAVWVRAQDSVGAALLTRGGRPMSCVRGLSERPPLMAVRYWRFRGYAVGLTAYRFAFQGQPWTEWMLQVDGFPGGPPACRGSRWDTTGEGSAPDGMAVLGRWADWLGRVATEWAESVQEVVHELKVRRSGRRRYGHSSYGHGSCGRRSAYTALR